LFNYLRKLIVNTNKLRGRTWQNDSWQMQAIEDLQFCDVVPLADRVEDLDEFLEVQEAVAVGVHQTKSSFDLNQKKCLVIIVVIVLIIIMFPQNNEPILIFKKIHFQDTFFDSAVQLKFVNRIFFRFFFCWTERNASQFWNCSMLRIK